MQRKSIVLRLYKAVYSLRIASKRYKDNIKELLVLLRFRLYPNDPILYTDNRIVIIVFVDDFLVAYYKSKSKYAY